ncbi:MAG: ASKHA domain-containing protein [Ilumatobacteraceae bacterium]
MVGVAVDIGSTTIAGHLCDLASGEVLSSAGRMNPQIRFGEDLMSRVSYVMMNPGGDRELTTAVRRALQELVVQLCDDAGVTTDLVLEVVLVGNPIMHHVVAGIDPTPLGQAPFTLATADALVAPATEFELGLPHAQVYLAPCIAGHVGADTAAVILSEGPHRSATTQLLVDVGTNAEIVVGDEHRQFAASSPTGPAFEGAQLSCGQRATAGAIERVRIDPATLEPRFKVIGCDLWSDEPGFADATADLGISGICGSGIIEVVGEMFLAGIIDADGVVQGALADRSPRVRPDGRTFRYVVHDQDGVQLGITQNDVRGSSSRRPPPAGRHRVALPARRSRCRRGHPARRRVRFAHRSRVRAGARARARLPRRPCPQRRQRRRCGCRSRPAVDGGASRDGAGGARCREDRDGHRARLPGRVRGGHGVPPRHGAVTRVVTRGRVARAHVHTRRRRTQWSPTSSPREHT